MIHRIRSLWGAAVTLKSYTSDRGTFVSATIDRGGNTRSNVLIDPQALVDALAELFPDVKPSPPKPKVGDIVNLTTHPFEGAGDGRVLHVFADGRAVVLWPESGDYTEHINTYRKPSMQLTVIERGES